jgi:hypothetical protein
VIVMAIMPGKRRNDIDWRMPQKTWRPTAVG